MHSPIKESVWPSMIDVDKIKSCKSKNFSNNVRLQKKITNQKFQLGSKYNAQNIQKVTPQNRKQEKYWRHQLWWSQLLLSDDVSFNVARIQFSTRFFSHNVDYVIHTFFSWYLFSFSLHFLCFAKNRKNVATTEDQKLNRWFFCVP